MTDDHVYLFRLQCPNGHRTQHWTEGPYISPEMDAPWPKNVYRCPACGDEYGDDLGACIVEDFEALIVEHPEIPPEDR